MPELWADAITLRAPEGPLVSDLSFRAPSGEMLGITGPSGSGKTSLMLVLGGLAQPESGTCRLDGEPVVLWRQSALGLVLQNLHLVPTLTAHEAVSLPMQARRIDRAEVARRADTTLTRLGLGDHTGQLVGELSGGQRQRVAVARALAGAPAVILADEPTSALDPHWRAVALEALSQASRDGAIVVVASSDPELIARCDRVVRLG